MRVLIFLTLFSLFFKISFAQSYQDQQNQVLAYNVLLNGFIGGIGGAINKK